jgi:predicted nucleic acid-binding Zn ribbon protein
VRTPDTFVDVTGWLRNVLIGAIDIRPMVRIPEHGHCENCGDPVAFDEHFCSDDCRSEYDRDVKDAKKLDNRVYALMALGLVIAAVAAYAVKIFLLS